MNQNLNVSPAHHTGYASIAEIVIDAPPKAVWPHLLNTGSWIYDFHFEHVSGPVGGEGEIRHLWPAGVATGGQKLSIAAGQRTSDNASTMTTLALVPCKLWHTVMPLKRETSGACGHGANIVVLANVDGRTHVSAIRSKEWYCPDQDVRDALAASALAYQPVAQTRWMQMYLPRLKALSEASWEASQSEAWRRDVR